MNPKFRAIPLTIFDMFAIIIPGCVWLIFFGSAWGILVDIVGTNPPVILSPFSTVVTFLKFLSSLGTGLGPFIFIMASLVIGYSIKPFAMRIAETITLPFIKLHPDNCKATNKSLRFP